MKIGLIDVDSKIPNLALMKISTYWKNRGAKTDWCYPINQFDFDKIYGSSIFTFSDKSWVPKNAIIGGTGYGSNTKLPDKIERCDPDYSIYPNCDFSIQRFSRGCIRKCPFCIVWKQDGIIKPIKSMDLNLSGKWIYVQDDNFFANPEWENAIKQLFDYNQPVQFEGVDVRLLDKKKCEYLNKLKLKNPQDIHIAWDNPKDKIESKIKEITKWIKPWKFTCYILTNYWSTFEQDLDRIHKLRDLKIDPYVMIYDKYRLKPRHKLLRLQRWVNNKIIFKSCEFEEYMA